MTSAEPVASQYYAPHPRDARSRRDRDLGIKDAAEGRAAAHVIRALPGAPFNGVPHRHGVTFQLVYVLKGWIEFEYEGQGVVRLEPGRPRYLFSDAR